MAIIKLTDKTEQGSNIIYEFDPTTKPLGEGGMGKVYRGTRIDVASGVSRQVAIKFMFEDLPQSTIERARREANIKVKHENLVEMMGFFTTETVNPSTGTKRNHYHVVSELLDGVVLSDLIEGVTTNSDGKIIPYAEKLLHLYRTDSFHFACTIVKSVLSGLISLHQNGFIHRDIDPSNIMITSDNKIKLIDFGIAKQVNSLATQDKSLTSSGQFMGKPQYAAPELVLGDIKNQNKTTDIYAVGMMFYQLITGKLPYSGTANDVIRAQLKSPLPVKNVQNIFARDVILKATNKKQELRYQSAAEFFAAVEQIENKKPSFWDKMKLPIIAGVIAALLIAGGLAWFLLGGKSSNGPVGTEEPPKVAAVVLYMVSPQTMNYYVLMEKDNEYVVNDTLSKEPFDPFDGQPDPDVSTDRVGKLVDTVITKITDSYKKNEVEFFFIAQQNFEKDADMQAFDERLKMKGYSISYFDPHNYPVDNKKECARQYVERHKPIKNVKD